MVQKIHQFAARFWVLLLILLSSSCTYEPFQTKTVDKNLLTNLTCGTNCNEKPSQLIHLHIDPSNSGFLPQQFLNIEPKKDLPATFELKKTFLLQGNIKIESVAKATISKNDSPSMSDIISLIPDTIAIPQSENQYIVTPINSQALDKSNTLLTADSFLGHFAFSLNAQLDYQIIFNPKGEKNIPPTFITTKLTENQSQSIVLNYEGSYVAGKLSFANLRAEELAQAYSAKLLQDEKIVSSIGKLGSNGEFTIQLASPLPHEANRKEKFLLTIEPNENYQYLPIIHQKMNLPKDDLTGKNISVDEIIIDNAPPVFHQTITVQNEEGNPIQDARAYIKGNLNGKVISQQFQSNSEGKILIKAFENNYKIAVMGPPNSEYGMFQDTRWTIRRAENQVITLPRRDMLEGKTFDHQNIPVEGALIQIVRIGKEHTKKPESVLEDSNWRIEARSNHEGKWCSQLSGAKHEECPKLWLDEGHYRVLITPPPGAKLPYQTTTFDFPQMNSLSITLTKPILIEGKVIDPESKSPISKAFIQIYSALQKLETKEPLLLGQTITDDEGRFIAYIASE